jgi:hypothetical protein
MLFPIQSFIFSPLEGRVPTNIQGASRGGTAHGRDSLVATGFGMVNALSLCGSLRGLKARECCKWAKAVSIMSVAEM